MFTMPVKITSTSKWLLIASITWCGNAFGIDQAALTTLLEDARREMEMPGLRAAVRLADGSIVSAAVGLADVEAEIPLDSTIGMPGGSTGKTFVAALTMLLVEDGTLSLDDPAARWLGDTPWYGRLPNAADIRVHHLLSHTSGIADYPDMMWFQLKSGWRALRWGSIKFEPEELIGFVLDEEPLFPAGEGYRYTDVGYLVLGRLIEAAAGRSYYELLDERILKPQQLHDVRPADRSILPDITPGYSRGARNMKPDGRLKFDPSTEWTGGGLAINPTMLVQFYAGLYEGHIVKPESFARMLSNGWRNPEMPDEHYGFGLFVFDDGKSFGHGGMWPGYRTRVVHYVSTGTTIAVQTNRDGYLDMQALVSRIAALVPSE